MKSSEKYLQSLKQWLQDTEDSPLEEMSDFFTKRLEGYEEHMSVWKTSYRLFAEALPRECRKILDLGCGTGLELDQIWQLDPDMEVTGIDLCESMLNKLRDKHPNKHLTLICGDYFQYDPGRGQWDAVISFESLHHFLPERKEELYRKLFRSLKDGGVFILGDYIACCDEEEELLRDTCLKRRKRDSIPEDRFVHFDIPLTLGHETSLLQNAGFRIEKVLEEDAVIIIGKKSKN